MALNQACFTSDVASSTGCCCGTESARTCRSPEQHKQTPAKVPLIHTFSYSFTSIMSSLHSLLYLTSLMAEIGAPPPTHPPSPPSMWESFLIVMLRSGHQRIIPAMPHFPSTVTHLMYKFHVCTLAKPGLSNMSSEPSAGHGWHGPDGGALRAPPVPPPVV